MATPVIVQPDLEAWVIAALRDLPGDVMAFSYTAIARDRLGLVQSWFIQVDARHSKKKVAARDLAERARQIITGLGARPWPEGRITYVQCVEGPFWLPDAEDGMPRYCARYEIRVSPVRRPGAQPEETA